MSRQLVDDWFGAFHDKDIAKLERTLAPDFIHSSPFGRITGGQRYIDIVKENADAFFSPKIDIQDRLHLLGGRTLERPRVMDGQSQD